MKFAIVLVLGLLGPGNSVFAAGAYCSQSQIEPVENLSRSYSIESRHFPRAFYEWYSNNGYCGEVSMIQAGMAFGQWTSQFNARLLCGSGLSQTGPDGYCAAHGNNPNYNSQMLLESPRAGDEKFASGPTCLENFALEASHFDNAKQLTGLPGYQQYMSWIKQKVIAGQVVAMAVTHKGHDSLEYDHIVTVVKIATNHDPRDSAYYDDDVIYFDDHGSYTIQNGQISPHHPQVPFAASQTPGACDPYIFAYTFARLPHTRAQANADGAPLYSIIIPGTFPTATQTGGDGQNPRSQPVVGANYGFAVSGPRDQLGESLPVWLEISAATAPDGSANPADPIAGVNYESPMVGTDVDGNSCTNERPQAMRIRLLVHVGALVPGQNYNLYLYKLEPAEVALGLAKWRIPTSGFNSNARLAAAVYRFAANQSVQNFTVDANSDQTLIFRAVPVSAR